MCDTMVAVLPPGRGGAVWFGKNSDREPNEAQVVEVRPAAKPDSNMLRVTRLEIPEAAASLPVVLSRPFWMWGAEMGANARGVAVGNEAVFTKLPVEKTGLLGMDLVRIALERASSAAEALELICWMIERYGQGGSGGYRKRFLYHNAFIVADPTEAWVLETADRFWAAERVSGVRTISNVLSIGRTFDRLGPGTYDYAKSRGWTKRGADFDFAGAFGAPVLRELSGGDVRRACTARALEGSAIDRGAMFRALRSHNGGRPERGWRLDMPCAHASWLPTRTSGQTVGSMVSRLSTEGSEHWLTGTSSPCLSVFKPVLMDGVTETAFGPPPGAGHDDSLFWRHERLHRAALLRYSQAARAIAEEQRALEALDDVAAWEEHRALIPDWTQRIEAQEKRTFAPLFTAYWARQDREALREAWRSSGASRDRVPSSAARSPPSAWG